MASVTTIPRMEANGAFWSPDPLLARRRLDSWLRPARRRPLPGLFHAASFLPLPVMTPAALQVESGARLLGFFRLPFVWLPDDVWGRYPGESLDVYQTRIFLAVSRMGLLTRTAGGQASFADCLGGARPTRRQAAGLSRWFDQGRDDAFVRPIFEDMNARAQNAWPGGYDPLLEEGTAARLASLLAVGCLPLQVLTLAHLFDLAGQGDPAAGPHARRVLHALHGRYRVGGHDYFSLREPEDHDPKSLARWAGEHKGLTDALLDRLVAAHLAQPRERGEWDAVMARARRAASPTA